MKMTKKKWIILVIVSALVFSTGYIYGRIKYKNHKVNENENTVLVSSKEKKEEDKIFPDSGEIVLRIKYTKSGKVNEERMSASEFSGTKREQIKSFYKNDGYGYVESESSDNKMVFEKNVEYDKGKYIIGNSNGYIAIFVVKSNGDLVIENKDDVTKYKVDRYPKNDQDLINNKIKQFNTKDEAKDFIVDTFES